MTTKALYLNQICRTIVCALLLGVLLYAPHAHANGALIKKAASEIVERLARLGGAQTARDLSQRFGREAVEDVLQRAFAEGGETAVARVSRIAGKYGANGLRAVSVSPHLMSQALDNLPEGLLQHAITHINRQPKLMAKAVQQYGARALQHELAHPGVGLNMLQQFGDDALRIGQKLNTNDMIRLARRANEIKTLPAAAQHNLFDMLVDGSGRVLGELDKHPNVLGACKSLGIAVIAVGGVTTVGKEVFKGTKTTVNPDGSRDTESGPMTVVSPETQKTIGNGVFWALIIIALAVPLSLMLVIYFRMYPGYKIKMVRGLPADAKKAKPAA